MTEWQVQELRTFNYVKKKNVLVKLTIFILLL